MRFACGNLSQLLTAAKSLPSNSNINTFLFASGNNPFLHSQLDYTIIIYVKQCARKSLFGTWALRG